MYSQVVILRTLAQARQALTPFHSLDKYSLDTDHVPNIVLSTGGSSCKQDGCQSPSLSQARAEVVEESTNNQTDK